MALIAATATYADNKTVSSPDGRLQVTIDCQDGRATYSVSYDGQDVLKRSALGLVTNLGDFTQGLTMQDKARQMPISKRYWMATTKRSDITYEANRLQVDFQTTKRIPLSVIFQVSNNDVAFCYQLLRGPKDNPKCAIVEREATAFNLADGTTTFLSPQITPMTGWERTKPSYEEEYEADAPMDKPSKYGVGYTFPCLFKVRSQGVEVSSGEEPVWLLISETGVTSQYCGARLSDYEAGKGYTIAYPQEGENNGFGSATASIMLPGFTPWRTITVGRSLAPIVETTVQFDVVDPLYEPSEQYQPGRYTWSWLVWQDNSVCYDDQVQMIDLSATMGYEYCLVDGLWDTQIGYDRIEELAAYAKQKGVKLMLWYNSNGSENDAPQGPRGVMNNAIKRKQDMAWMKRIGVKAIKVDFFGGDKQETMRLYEDILSDANDYGLQVIFHGCTLPRGWERMYPNYVASEAALASENVYFTEHHARQEGFEMSMHPFSRNAVGSFDWGGMMMNRFMSRDNKSRHQRFTGDIFELATAITNQTSVNCVAIYPNNLHDLPPFELDFLRRVPTTWQETRYVDGYPTRYAVIARRASNGKWYVGGINGTAAAMTLTLDLPMLAGKTVTYYVDEADAKALKALKAAAKKDPKAKPAPYWPTPAKKTLKVDKNGQARVTLQSLGGIVLVEE
ncbi:MAG: glycoside hydrolase family 97 catalytic domain-containing protein [Prevotella sp.]|nr:glycoside hydrolase family 97 catalytic domain-containing protein [Prevotella sp.]